MEILESLESVDDGDLAGAQEELMDALWYLLLACESAGLKDGHAIVNHYLNKARINQERMQTKTKPHLSKVTK